MSRRPEPMTDDEFLSELLGKPIEQLINSCVNTANNSDQDRDKELQQAVDKGLNDPTLANNLLNMISHLDTATGGDGGDDGDALENSAIITPEMSPQPQETFQQREQSTSSQRLSNILY